MAETLTTVRTSVLNFLGDSGSTVWSTAEINTYIQEGYDDLVMRTRCLWTYGYLDDVAGTATYTLPTDLIDAIDRSTWNWQALRPSTIATLSRIDQNFRTTSGNPVTYVVGADGLRTLRKYPVPAATPASGADALNFRIEYYNRGTALVASSQENFDIPDRYVKYIKFFCCWKALKRDGPGQDLKFAEHFKQRYNAGIIRMIRRTGKSKAIKVRSFDSMGRTNRRPVARFPWAYGREVGYPPSV